MNEPENLRIIKELEKDIQAGNLDGLMSKLAEDVVWNIPGPSLYPFAGCYRGHEQIKNVFALAAAIQTEFIEPKEFIAQGNKVVVLVATRIQFKTNNRVVELETSHIFTLRGGKVTEFLDYMNI
ncbi:MAG: SnoaL-like domain-containing protein [Thioploca sp.]|nr:SnoaL-like domain-containing protein [Thioploca sp.]